MAKQSRIFLRERLAMRRKQRAEIIGNTGMIPDDGLRKCSQTSFIERRIGINATPLAAVVTENSFFRDPTWLESGFRNRNER